MTKTNTEEIVFSEWLPKHNRIIRFILYFPVLLHFNLFRSIIIKSLKNVTWSCYITPWLKFIYWKNIALSDTRFLDYANIYIWEWSRFSFENMVITSTHDRDNWNIVRAKPIIIWKNVWITSRVIILWWVTIWDNSIIWAGSVVTKDIPANCFAAGNPCKVINFL